MMKQAKSGIGSKYLSKQWVKSPMYLGCLVSSLCVGGPASASDTFNGFISKLLPPESCVGKIDWFQVGMSDGRHGIEPSYFSVYEQLCARRSKKPNREAYFTAYSEGIRSYCSPENIYQIARTGAVAIGACEDSAVIHKAVQDGFANLLEQ